MIAKICWRLDGIPQAIELAAARIKVLSLDQIFTGLDNRFRLLSGGSRAALPRQQTLGALIDWSYDLLSEREPYQRALDRLRGLVSDQTFESEWQKGRALDFKASIELAMEDTRA